MNLSPIKYINNVFNEIRAAVSPALIRFIPLFHRLYFQLD